MSQTNENSVVGQEMPVLELKSTGGKEVFTSPKDFQGKWSLVYFYPKDDTPGCTTQACAYRDNIATFKSLNAQVIGVSKDDVASHDSFVEKFSLNFPLIADTEKKLAEFFQVRSRDSFLVDPQGVVRFEWRGVNPSVTVEETLNALRESVS